MYKLEIGKKGLLSAAEKEADQDIAAGYTRSEGQVTVVIEEDLQPDYSLDIGDKEKPRQKKN